MVLACSCGMLFALNKEGGLPKEADVQAAFKARNRTERSKNLVESAQDIYLAALKARGQLASLAVGPSKHDHATTITTS